MACVNADGTLTPIAQKVLSALEPPATISEINQRSEIPLYRVRASVRELADLGMLEVVDGLFYITRKGRTQLGENEI
jgi:predicted methyltransferase